MTTPLFLLRSVELGISIRDLDLLTIGLVLDMWTEKSNDGVKYKDLPLRRTSISSETLTSQPFLGIIGVMKRLRIQRQIGS